LSFARVVDLKKRITYPLKMSTMPKIFSMTGFGRSAGSFGKFSWNWETKSVNGKGLDIKCRLPHGLEILDLKARKIAGQKFSRGNINLTLSIKENGNQPSYRVNRELLDELIKTAREMFEGTDSFGPLRPDSFLAVKGVIEPVEEEPDVDVIQERDNLIIADLEKALSELSLARKVEGTNISQTLELQLAEIQALIERAGRNSESQPQAIREQLKQQMEILLDATPALPEERITQEAVMLMIKVDVREELDRLRAHTSTARKLLIDGRVIGRKLDFLCQELNREVNTLCSKANNIELSNIGLDLKALIEQFREQVQNIE